MSDITVGSAVSSGMGKTKGLLEVGDLPDGTPVEIPVVIVRGAKEGPVLWLHGCVHGDEYCGTFIIHHLLRSLDPEDLSGAVVALPILNLTAFMKNQRMSPFELMAGGDLNRCFPGKPDGSFSEQMAHAIYGPLREQADYLVDFHTALTEDVRWALFANPAGEVGGKSEGMARAFGYKSTFPTPMDMLIGSSMITAAGDGIPALIVEAGGRAHFFTDETVADGAERLANVMRHLGMLEGEVTDHGPLNFFSEFAWINSTRGGLFQCAVRCHDVLQEGDILGHYYNLHGDMVEEVKSPRSGVVLAINSGPAIVNGDVLVHMGVNPREV